MGKNISRLCFECFQPEDQDHYIPLVDTSDPRPRPPVKKPSYEELKIQENHPQQDYFFRLIEDACIEFLSHIRCEFHEAGFVEALKKPNILVLSKENEKGYALKSEYFIECTPDDIIHLMLDTKNRKTWDSTVEIIEDVAILPEETSVTYIKYKGMMMISPRDVLVVNRVMKAQNGLIFVSTSCKLDSHPENSGIVRANVDVSGYYVEPAPENKSHIIGYTLGEAGGKLPKALVKTATVTALPSFIKSIQTAVKKLSSKES
jgi:hypothetical protein